MNQFAATLACSLALTGASVLADESRIYPQSLLSDTPKQAAESFVERFSAQDYFAVYYLLSPQARGDFFKTFQVTFSFEHAFIGSDGAMPPGSIMHPDTEPMPEILADRSLTFDDLLFHAAEADMLPFTFGPEASIGAVAEGGLAATAAIATGGEPAEVTLHLVDHQGAWFVDRITWAGSKGDLRPWSVGTGR